MSLIPDPALPPDPHALEIADEKGVWGGPTYRYRGAEIRCFPGGHICALFMPEHPWHKTSFGASGTVTTKIDAWLDGVWPPPVYKAKERD